MSRDFIPAWRGFVPLLLGWIGLARFAVCCGRRAGLTGSSWWSRLRSRSRLATGQLDQAVPLPPRQGARGAAFLSQFHRSVGHGERLGIFILPIERKR